MKERLLKRIRRWQQLDNASAEADSNELVASIRDDLEKLFNTRLGTVQIDEAFGLMDFSDLFSRYSEPDGEAIGQALQSLTRRYEKRLQMVEVREETAGTAAGEARRSVRGRVFRLHASLPYRDGNLAFSSKISIHDDGRITVAA